MADNSFMPTFGNRPSRIIGREKVISDCLGGLGGVPGNPDRATLFIGQRGMGKTVLLIELADQAAKAGFVPARITANETMLDKTLQFIQINGAQYVKGAGKGVKGFQAGALGFSLGLTFSEETEKSYGFHVKLMLLCDELAKSDKGVFLLIDEVQASSPQMRELATTYQHLVGEGKNIAIAMAGLPHAISNVLNDDLLTFLNRAKHVPLGPVSISDIAAYYASVFSSKVERLDTDAIARAASATRGYPYLLQLVGYYLTDLVVGQNKVTREYVDAAVSLAKRAMAETVFTPVLKPLSDNDRRFLKAMAEMGQKAGIGAIQKKMGVSRTYAQQYRRRLIEDGIIAPVRRGELEFIVPYLDEYLREVF
jgi:hypothetical protein